MGTQIVQDRTSIPLPAHSILTHREDTDRLVASTGSAATQAASSMGLRVASRTSYRSVRQVSTTGADCNRPVGGQHVQHLLPS